LPIHNRKEANKVRAHIDAIFQERLPIMLVFLGASDLKVPRPRTAFILPFFLPAIGGGITISGHIILNARLLYSNTDQEIRRTIDHELTHCIQLSLNRKLRWLNPFFIERRKFFTEGFAEFVTSLTEKNSPGPKVTRGIAALIEGKKVKGELDYYVRGYLAFRIIAKFTSNGEAMQLGMTSNFSDLKKRSRKLCQALGISSYL
jgi:hypothetical protein